MKRKRRETSYIFHGSSTQILKTVHWFRVEPIQQAGTPNPQEVQESGWSSLPEAHEKLAYRSDRGLLQAAEEAMGDHEAG